MICYFDGVYSQGMATGLTRYSDNLLRALDRHPRVQSGEFRGTVFGFRGLGPFRIKFDHLAVELLSLPVRLNFYGNALLGGPDLQKRFRQKPDLVHYHDVTRFSADQTRTRAVITVHDVSSLTSPRHYERRANFIKRRALRRIEKSQALLVADSENTRREVLDHCAIAPERVKVVHLGVDEIFFDPSRADLDFPPRQGLRPAGYALFVGRYHPRKNFEGLLGALRLWREKIPTGLVFAGPDMAKALDRLPAYQQLGTDERARVLALPSVSDRELAGLYGSALCLLYPSWHEGFGLPVLEAMAGGAPVICSPRGSLSEVAGDAARIIEPDDLSGLAAAVMEFAENPELRRAWIQRGQERARRFTWDQVADRMIGLFEREVS